MNTRLVLAAMALTLTFVGASPSVAHHAFGGDYDLTRPTRIQGTVVKIRWAYPHVQFTLRGRDRNGAIVELRVEASSPTILKLLGWTKDTLTPGMNVRVGGYPARNNQYNDFGSTTVTIISPQRVLKTPACWLAWSSAEPELVPSNITITVADVENMNAQCSVPEVL